MFILLLRTVCKLLTLEIANDASGIVTVEFTVKLDVVTDDDKLDDVT